MPEIRELRYFQAVAEELNVTRAANRLNIAQPALSRAMRLLERRLGVDLFDRTGHRLALTRAGEVLLKEATAVISALDTAVRRTQQADERELVVTAKPGVATQLLRGIRERFRDVRVVVSGFGEQADLVRKGHVDLAIAACVDGHDLDTELIRTEPRHAALATGHALAMHDVLTTADLRTEPAPRWSDPRVVDRGYWLGHPDRPTGPEVRDTAQLLDVVALGQGVALVPASLAAVNVRPDVQYRPVSDAAPYRTYALWPAGGCSPRIARFVQAAHQVAESFAATSS